MKYKLLRKGYGLLFSMLTLLVSQSRGGELQNYAEESVHERSRHIRNQIIAGFFVGSFYTIVYGRAYSPFNWKIHLPGILSLIGYTIISLDTPTPKNIARASIAHGIGYSAAIACIYYLYGFPSHTQ